jgi:hypothetical protein
MGFSTGTLTEAQRITYMFKRATGFFDVVAYTGDWDNYTISRTQHILA